MFLYAVPNRSRQIAQGALLAGFLTAVIVGLFIIGIVYAPSPIILGTERNADGSLEYLCLGTSCEYFRPMN